MQKVKRKRRKCRVLDQNTIDILYNTPSLLKHKIVVGFARYTSLRRIDITQMRIEYINFNTNRMFFPKQQKTKTPVGLKLPVEFISCLRTYISEHRDGKESGWMFPSDKEPRKSKGLSISVRTMSNWFIKIIKECKLFDVTLHDCRATFFTRGKVVGVQPDMMSDVTGTSRATIDKHYTHYTPEEVDEAFDKMSGDK